jgi:hypothetical protein
VNVPNPGVDPKGRSNRRSFDAFETRRKSIMGKIEHDYRIQPQRLRPLGLPSKSLVGIMLTLVAAFVFATTTEALSAWIG